MSIHQKRGELIFFIKKLHSERKKEPNANIIRHIPALLKWSGIVVLQALAEEGICHFLKSCNVGACYKISGCIVAGCGICHGCVDV